MSKRLKCCPFCGGRLAASVIQDFVRECCVRDDRHFETAADLRACYRAWCRRKRIEPVSETAFGRALGDAGFVNHRGHTVRWFGLRLTARKSRHVASRQPRVRGTREGRARPSRAQKRNPTKGIA